MRLARALALLGAGLAAGCNGGLVAIGASSSGGSSGGGNPAPVVSALQAPRTPTSPASITFEVVDQNGDPTDVSIDYRAAGGAFQAITLDPASNPLTGIPSNPGAPYQVLWDFAADLGGEAYVSGLELQVTVANGTSPPVLTGLELGNDAPQVVSAEALPLGQPEYGGNVDVGFTAMDSASDPLKIRVEYNDDAAGGFPATSWKLARPAATPLSQPTPPYAITGFQPDPAGVMGTFRWDTGFDLDGFDADVRVRFTPEDAFVAGATFETADFRVDNNQLPSAFIEEGALVANPDELREIAVPFTLFDEEGDDAQVVVQWRRAGETFPALPADPAALAPILADPVQRAALQIVTEIPYSVSGKVDPIDASSVRVPEVGGPASTILGVRPDLVGDELAILRDSPRPSALGLPGGLLLGPVAALPVGDGTRALVLDRSPAGAGWRLREIELGSGAVVRSLASVAGALPSTMVLEHGGQAALVAEELGNTWQLQRVDLTTGATQLLVGATGASAPVHGMVSFGTGVAILTAGRELIRVGYDALGQAQTATLLDDLDEPRGLVADPLQAHRVYLAERGAPGPSAPGRVRALELDALGENVVLVNEGGLYGAGFPRPTDLALERGGARLLVLTDSAPLDGVRELRGVDLGGFELGTMFEVADDLAGDATGLATGPDGLRVLAYPAAGDLAVGGGVEQKRTVVGYDPSVQAALVTPPFSPAPRGGQTWRWSKRTDLPFGTDPSGARGFLIWDSQDISGGGQVILRLTPYDADQGVSHSSTGAKSVRAPQDGDVVQLSGMGLPEDVVAADLNGDGLLDLASGNVTDLTVFFQTAQGAFPASPDLTLGGAGITDSVYGVVAADLNDDGRLDLASANTGSDTLTVFFQAGLGQFPTSPDLTLGGAGSTTGPQGVAAADLNDDGLLDLVSANRASRKLTVFFQTSPGQFPTTPDVGLGGTGNATTERFVRVADVDGDGLLDLVTSIESGQKLKVFFQTSPGQFSTNGLAVGGNNQTLGIWIAAVADLNGDGLMDLVAGNHFLSNLAVFFQSAPRQFPATPDLTLGSTLTTQRPTDLQSADLNGDGLLDLVATSNISVDVTVFFQTGPGQFETSPSLALETTGTSPSGIAVADLDGDGLLDLVTANRSSSDLLVLYQSGPGQFPTAPDVTISAAARELATGDLNGDGLLDLAAATSPFNLLVYFQTNPGQYPTSPDLVLGGSTTTLSPRRVVTADLNGDGLTDLVTCASSSRNLAVFFRSASGQFSASPDLVLGGFPATQNPNDVVAADLNDDDRVDLACVNLLGDDLTVFFQSKSPSSPGSFPTDPDLSLGTPATMEAPYALAAADLNGDDLVDLVTANSQSDNLSVFYQSSAGQFPTVPDLTLGNASTTDGPFSVAVADLNGDGLPDLVSANLAASTLTVFFQTDLGQFLTTPDLTLGDFSTTQGPQHVEAVDLDADGQLDLVAATSSGWVVFRQTSPGRFPAAPSFSVQPTGFGGAS